MVERNQLELYIYTDRLLKIDVNHRIHNDATINVIETKGSEDQAYITIDSAQEGKSEFFKIINISSKPLIMPMETTIGRPVNIDKSVTENRLVGFMNQGGE
jgi:hypothetical protein